MDCVNFLLCKSIEAILLYHMQLFNGNCYEIVDSSVVFCAKATKLFGLLWF